MLSTGPGRINYDTLISHFAVKGTWESYNLELSFQDRKNIALDLIKRGVFSEERSMPNGYDYDRGDIALEAETNLCSRPVRLELRYKAENDTWRLTVYQRISGTLRATEARYIQPELQKLVEGWFTVEPVQSENKAYCGIQ